VVKKAGVTGYGNVSPKDVTIGFGQSVRGSDIFPDPPPYGVLRVDVLGDTVDQNLRGVKPGTSTLVFYNWAGDEVGRSTVTVLNWWQSLPSFLQFLLRWFCFGWLWMA